MALHYTTCGNKKQRFLLSPFHAAPPAILLLLLASLVVASSQGHPLSLHHLSTWSRLDRGGLSGAEVEEGQSGARFDAAHGIIAATGTNACTRGGFTQQQQYSRSAIICWVPFGGIRYGGARIIPVCWVSRWVVEGEGVFCT